ncbi:MAG: PAS domain S-box protein [Candidatus Krumholzibacteria bacterium]|nr:PAS domain S-box protein [Candidatus Krumholzibacteria bacterium]
MEREHFYDAVYSPARDKDELIRELSAVMEMAEALNSRLDLDHILSKMSSELARIIDYDMGCLAIYEKDDNCLYIRHIYRRNGDTSYEGRFVPLEESNVVGWVAIHRKPVLRRDISVDNRFSEIMKEDNLYSDIVVPLIAKDSLIGTLNLGSYKKNRFSEFDLELVTRFSQLTSIAIENSQLIESHRALGEKYRTLMSHASDVIALINYSGEVVECNDVVYRYFGYTPEEVLGKSYWLFTTPDRRDFSRTNLARVLKGETTTLTEVPYLKKNGEIVYMDVTATLVKIKGHPYVLGVGHDVTERKMLEERITIQNRELTEVNRKLMQLDQLKSEFLGRISHELRTPLAIIMAYSDTLIEDSGFEIEQCTRREFLEIIDAQSKKLLAAINDLLDLSKVEVSDTMLNVTEASVNEMIRLSVKMAEPSAHKNDITIVTELDESLPIAMFDPQRIRQVCVNLIGNAIKFSASGGKVTVSSTRGDGEIIVSVRDEGPGMDPGETRVIFENFTQVDGGTDRSRNGLGIGLRLVNHYISLHRGRIWVESEKGEGSVFRFALPMSNCLADKIKISQ